MSTSYDHGQEQYGNYYSAGTARIQAKLVALGLPQAHPEQLYNGLLDRFEGRDWLMSRALLSANDPSDWHAVSFPESSPLLSREDPLCVASDANTALGYCLELLDADRVFATEIRPSADGADIYLREQVIASIRRIRFEAFQPEIRSRVEKALKGVRRYGDDDRLIARVRTLPGFSEAGYSLSTTHHKAPDGCLLIPYPSNWAKAMHELMESLSIPAKLSQAQELVAAFFAASSWHQLISHQDEERCWLMPCGITDNYGDFTRWRFFKTTAESIYAFGTRLKGQGATTTITSLDLSISMTAIHITAHPNSVLSGNRWDIEPLLTCTSPTCIEVGEAHRYEDDAAALWTQLRYGEAVSLSSGSWQTDLQQSNRRLGYENASVFQIGDWFFRKQLRDSLTRTYLSIEQIVDGAVRFKTDPFPIYKGEGRYDEGTKNLTILADYGRDVIAQIPDVCATDLGNLKVFLRNGGDMGLYPAFKWSPQP